MDKIVKNCEFQPSPKQIKFAEIYLDLSIKVTFIEVAKRIGVHNNTITNWLKNPEFVKWINNKKSEILDKSLISRYKTAIRKAESGDFSFSKLLFEMQGEYLPQQKIEGLESKVQFFVMRRGYSKEEQDFIDSKIKEWRKETKLPFIIKDDPDNELSEEGKLILKKENEKELEEIKENIED